MPKYQCPGEFERACGKIVEGEYKSDRSDVVTLEKHSGCKRRYIFESEGIITPTKSPLELLVDAKLAGTTSPGHIPIHYNYLFRTNEQAAELAIRVLENAGYEIVLKDRGPVVKNSYFCGQHEAE